MSRTRSTGVARALAPVVIVSLAVFVSACGSSSDSDSKSTTSAADSGGTVKIGVMVDQTGPAASYGQHAMQGIQQKVDEINKAGGVNGKQLEIEAQDGGGTKETSIAVMRKLASDKSVIGLIGPTSTDSLVVDIPVATQQKIPLVAPTSRGPIPVPFGDYVFRTAVPIDVAWPPLMQTIVQRNAGVKTVGIIYASDNPAMVGEKDTVTKVAGQQGLQVVGSESYTTGATSFLSQLTKLKDKNPDIMEISGVADDGAVILRQMKQLGFKPRVLSGIAGMNDPSWFKSSGGEGVGFVSVGFTPETTDAAAKTFVDGYQAKNGKAAVTIDSAYGYDAAGLLADALKRAGTGASRDQIREALSTTSGFQGATGEFTYKGGGDRTATPKVPLIKMSSDGQFVPWTS